jgi:endonuclease-8
LRPRGEERRGTPWLVLRGDSHEGVLWNGPVLELHTRAIERLGPDILAQPPDVAAMLARLRARDATRWFGEALLDQSIVAGIGNMWLAESLFEAKLSPWRRVRDVPEDDRRLALETAARLMGGPRRRHRVYRRTGMPCPCCRGRIRSWGQGDANRMAYWCPVCQVGEDPPGA